jgi:glycoprotein 6-alpha-L-fucosyltransferase/import inner membrane translocase subunit TIM50
MLLLALNSGRVLAEIPGTYLTDHPYCGNRSTIDTCYFQPLTHCKVSAQQIMSAYKLNGTAGSSDQAAFMQGDPEGIDKLGQYLSADKLFPQKSRVSQTVPKAFQHLLQNSGIPSKNLYYWWRSQAVAYIVRPNAQALNEIAVRKR